jgi:Zn-finger nucleic acid-binding protein
VTQEKTPDLSCPTCGENLAAKNFHGQVVQKCFKCGGFWFDSEGLALAQRDVDRSIDWPENLLEYANKLKVKTGRSVACPRDGAALISLHYGHSEVVVDICPKCHGVWFDQGEFNKVAQDLKDASVGKTSLEYLKEVAHEIAEIFTGRKSMTEELEDVKKTWHLFKNRLAIDHPFLKSFIIGLGKTFA